MNLQELRIGNYYKWTSEGKEYYFKIEPRDFTDNNYKNFEPIELTEEILFKCGFKKIKDNTFEHDLSFYDIELQGNKIAFVLWSEENPSTTHYVLHSEFLHEFQNAFYLLNDKQELTINL